MTLLAGVYARRSGDRVDDSVCQALQNAISRHPGERVESFRDDRCFLAKVDVGAFGDRAFCVTSDAVSILAGAPLLRHEGGAPRSRSADLTEIHDSLGRDSVQSLRTARGVFCAAHYRPATGTLLLTTDKLGIRPIYYWVGERYVIFATALRILEHIRAVEKVMDLRAVTEISAFGYVLGTRTPFMSVRLLLPAEIVAISGGTVSSREYWRWDDIAVSDRPIKELAKDAYDVFVDAVALRQGSDSTTTAFLSGGLDSRAIVAALRDRQMNVHTFNFALPGSQDQVFGADYASRVGVMHIEAPMEPGNPAWSAMMASSWDQSPNRTAFPPEHPQLVWSGDGGSVVLGHVYLDSTLVASARTEQPSAVADRMNRKWGGDVVRRLMRPAVTDSLAGLAARGLAEELGRFPGADAGRALHLLLLFNDQRRHLTEHFEGIDLHRLEFQLPFFDSEFVESVLRVPIDECLGHKFYMAWLKNFPPETLSVPWQAYPGHEPCPLPIPPALDYQWKGAGSRQIRAANRRNLLDRGAGMLKDRDFPDDLLRRRYLRLATWIHRLRMRDLAHVIRAASVYHSHSRRSLGKFELPK